MSVVVLERVKVENQGLDKLVSLVLRGTKIQTEALIFAESKAKPKAVSGSY